MQSPTPAAAPDPVKTAAAQAASNKDTAVAQYGLNATNQITPSGSLNYSQIGTWADGTPRFQAETSLSPTEQGIFNTGEETKQNLATIGRDQSSRIGQLLSTPFDLNSARDSKIAGIQQKFLDPQWARQKEALDAENFNKGIRPGTEAYQNAQQDFSTNRQRAYDQSYLDSYNAGNTAALAERNQPINEISALLSGSQVSQPNFTSTPTPGVAPTDVIGAQQQALNQHNVGFNAQQQSYMGMMNGLFGLGKTALGAGMSGGMGGWGSGGGSFPSSSAIY